MNALRGAIVILVLLATGCSSNDGNVDGPLLTSAGGSGDGMGAVVAGPLGFQDGCLLLGEMPVVWPDSTRWDTDEQALTLPSGDVARVGVNLTGGGGYMQLAAIADLFGKKVADAARPCLGPTGEVAVFNRGSDVEIES